MKQLNLIHVLLSFAVNQRIPADTPWHRWWTQTRFTAIAPWKSYPTHIWTSITMKLTNHISEAELFKICRLCKAQSHFRCIRSRAQWSGLKHTLMYIIRKRVFGPDWPCQEFCDHVSLLAHPTVSYNNIYLACCDDDESLGSNIVTKNQRCSSSKSVPFGVDVRLKGRKHILLINIKLIQCHEKYKKRHMKRR